MELEQLLPMQDKKSLESRLFELKRVLRVLEKKTGDLVEEKSGGQPPGRLKITHKHGRPEFYHITERGSSRGCYIPVAQREFAAQLAQRDYDLKVIKLIKREIDVLENYLQQTDGGRSVEALYEGLCKTRQVLIEPVTLSDEQYAERWKMKVLPSAGEGMPFAEDSQKYYTANGERVRSKSEVIIADALLRNGVPYCYEVPLKLKRSGEAGSVTFHPDFLCLNVRTRKEFYWEHFGKMGNEDYKENVVGKLNLYVENGFFPGRNLIFTMESGEESLDTRVVEKMIKEFLL